MQTPSLEFLWKTIPIFRSCWLLSLVILPEIKRVLIALTLCHEPPPIWRKFCSVNDLKCCFVPRLVPDPLWLFSTVFAFHNDNGSGAVVWGRKCPSATAGCRAGQQLHCCAKRHEARSRGRRPLNQLLNPLQSWYFPTAVFALIVAYVPYYSLHSWWSSRISWTLLRITLAGYCSPWTTSPKACHPDVFLRCVTCSLGWAILPDFNSFWLDSLQFVECSMPKKCSNGLSGNKVLVYFAIGML